MAEPPFRVTVDDGEVVVRISEDLVDRDELSKFLDHLVRESLRRRSGETFTGEGAPPGQ